MSSLLSTHPKSFVHLHLHTQYSLLDGALRIKDLMSKCKEFGMPAVASTDHGNMFGAIDFYQQAKGAGIKPLIGSEIYFTPGSRFDKKSPKISGRLENYNEWWLYLVDCLGFGLNQQELLEVMREVGNTGSFNKVVVLDYHGQNAFLTIQGEKA